MSTLREALQEYLKLRRSLGYKMRRRRPAAAAVRRLPRRATASSTSPRAGAAVGAAVATVQPAEWARRLGFVRGFARYRSRHRPADRDPRRRGCCRTDRHALGHTCTPSRGSALAGRGAATADAWPSTPLRPRVFHCLFGLLSVTGLRISEALDLQVGDVDLGTGRADDPRRQARPERLVPIHATTCACWASTCERRERFLGRRVLALCLRLASRQPARSRARAPHLLRVVAPDRAARRREPRARGCTTSVIASRSRC